MSATTSCSHRSTRHLKHDLRLGRLARPDEITITWNKELGPVQTGPFDLWMLREPQNIMLEVGSHSVAHMLDLVGPAEIIVSAGDKSSGPARRGAFLPSLAYRGRSIDHRRDVELLFRPGFSEHSIHIRGSLASATVDFERNTYLLHRHTPVGLDFDRYQHDRVRGQVPSGARPGTRSAQVVLSKLRRSVGNPYGQSIARALQSFYAHLADSTDARLSPELGRDVVRTCLEIGRRAGIESEPADCASGVWPGSTPNDGATGAESPSPDSDLGGDRIHRPGTGQATDRRRSFDPGAGSQPQPPARRTAKRRGRRRRGGPVPKGSISAAALDGIRCVYHLARSHVKTWEEYAEHEIEVTRRVAEACLTAKVERLIYTGTIDSYYAGAKAGTITEETPLDPHIDWRNYYARAKALSEQCLMSLHRQRGLPVVIFRPGIVIGQGEQPTPLGYRNVVVERSLSGLGRGTQPSALGPGRRCCPGPGVCPGCPWDRGRVVQPCRRLRPDALDYLDALEECTGGEFQKIPTPPWKFYVTDVMKWMVKRAIRHPDRRRPSYRDWETRTQRAHYDCSKARKLLSWNPTSVQAEIIRRGIQLPAQEQLA